jgi:hypothetical protein
MAAENLVALSAEEFNNLQFPSLTQTQGDPSSVDTVPAPFSWLNQALNTAKAGYDIYKDVVSTAKPQVYDKNGNIVIPDNALIQKEQAAALTEAAKKVAITNTTTNIIGILIVIAGIVALFFVLRRK